MGKITVLILGILLISPLIFALPQLTNVGFTSDDGLAKVFMNGNANEGFYLVNNGNPLTEYEIQFTQATGVNETLDEEMFPLTLSYSTTSVSDIEDYYDARGVPEPFLSYLKDAANGLEPFAYINGTTLEINDGAHYEFCDGISCEKYIGMIIPGDFPSGIYKVQGEVENEFGGATDVEFTLIVGAIFEDETLEEEVECVFNESDITLQVKVIGEVENTWFSYTIGGENYNETAVLLGDKYSATLFGNELPMGVLAWKVYASNEVGNVFSSSFENSFYIPDSTYLGIYPYPANGSNGWYINEPRFSLLGDLNSVSQFYQWDSDPDGEIEYSGLFGLEDIPNQAGLTGIESAGILELNWWSEFACGYEPWQTTILYIDLTDPTIVPLYPEGNEVVNTENLTVEILIDEKYQSNSGLDNSSIAIWFDSVPVNDFLIESINSIKTKISFNKTGLSPKTYNISVYAKDNAGRESQKLWNFEVVEPGSFLLQVHSPTNDIYDSKKVLLNISTSEKVEKIELMNYNDRRPKWQRLCKDCDSYERKKTLNEGENNITIRATGKHGAVEERNVSLFIDSKIPKVLSMIPKKKSVTNGSDFYIKYTEENLKEIKLLWEGANISDDETLNCTSGKSQKCFTSINLEEHDNETIDYWYEISDGISTVITGKTFVFVDTMPPILIINMPQNVTYSDAKVLFNISVSEDVVLEYMDTWDERPQWKRLCVGCSEFGLEKEKTKTFRKGLHEVVVRATDEAGNFDENSVEFVVDY